MYTYIYIYHVYYDNIWVDPRLNLGWVSNRKYIILPNCYIQIYIFLHLVMGNISLLSSNKEKNKFKRNT